MNENDTLAQILAVLEKQTAELGTIRAEQSEMHSRLTKMQMNIENVVMPRLDLLFEGHTSILEKMQHDTRLQLLQDRVDTLESAIKYLSTELNHLKRTE